MDNLNLVKIYIYLKFFVISTKKKRWLQGKKGWGKKAGKKKKKKKWAAPGEIRTPDPWFTRPVL